MEKSIALLYPGWRQKTDPATGLVKAADAIPHFDRTRFGTTMGFGSRTLYLGDEWPVYEIQFRGQMYRLLCRPRKGEAAHELIRCKALGLKADGILLAPPEAIPNTPQAFLAELMALTGATAQELTEDAYDILSYRETNKAYPATETPEGYRLQNTLLLVKEGPTAVRSLYDEASRGVYADRWTLFLHSLDAGFDQKLMNYLGSSISLRELGERNHQNAVLAAKLKFGVEKSTYSSQTSYSSIAQIVLSAEGVLAAGRHIGNRGNPAFK